MIFSTQKPVTRKQDARNLIIACFGALTFRLNVPIAQKFGHSVMVFLGRDCSHTERRREYGVMRRGSSSGARELLASPAAAFVQVRGQDAFGGNGVFGNGSDWGQVKIPKNEKNFQKQNRRIGTKSAGEDKNYCLLRGLAQRRAQM